MCLRYFLDFYFLKKDILILNRVTKSSIFLKMQNSWYFAKFQNSLVLLSEKEFGDGPLKFLK